MLISAFIFGLLSSLHCVGMCGPIAFALPVHKGTVVEKWSKIMMYHLGRLFTYAIIGALFGLFGRSFVLAGLQQVLSFILGFLLIILALSYKKIMFYIESKSSLKIGIFIKKAYQKIAQSSSLLNFFNLGVVNGLLPCGTVYIALIGALASSNVLSASLYMFFFGLGTLPLMIFLWSAKLFKKPKFQKIYKTALPIMLFIVGGLLILRGMDLDIAFISPKNLTLQVNLVPVGCH